MLALIDNLAGAVLGMGGRRTRIFPGGWGDRDLVGSASDADLLSGPPAEIDIVWGRKEEHRGFRVTKGQFASPISESLPSAARVVPVERWEPAAGSERTVIMLPAWNDHGFIQRRRLASLLIAHRIATVMFDIPFYGARRVVGESEQAVRTVSDFMVMGHGALAEAHSLASSFASKGLTGFAGFSMGGNLAALASATSQSAVATAALAASYSPGPVYLEGVLRRAIAWEALGGPEQADSLREALGAVSVLNFEPRAYHRTAVVLAATSDGFVPLKASQQLAQHWGAELQAIPGGHASALWRHRPDMASAIADAFDRLGAHAP